MRRLTAIGAAALSAIAALALAACARGEGSAQKEKGPKDPAFADSKLLSPDSPEKITFYTYNLIIPSTKPGIEHLVREFNETVGKEKGVIVEAVADDMTKWRNDIAGGLQVDVVQHAFAVLDGSRESMGLKAYEDIFPPDELSKHFEGISDNALSLGKIGDKIYGLAFTFSTPILYINKTLFKRAGLDPDDPPETWDEVAAAAKAIKEKTGVDGFGLAPNNGWTSEGLIYSNGGEVLSADRSKASFAGAAAVEAYSMWNAMYLSGYAAQGEDRDIWTQFASGKMGMHLQSTSLLSGFLAGAKAGGWELAGAPMPRFGNKPSAPVNSGSCLAVRSDSPKKSAAIWEFVKFVTGPRGYTIITSEIGYLPLRTGLADDPAYLKPFVDANPLLRVNIDQLSRIHPVVIWPGEIATEAASIFMDATVQAISTKNDVQATLKAAEDRINALLSK